MILAEPVVRRDNLGMGSGTKPHYILKSDAS